MSELESTESFEDVIKKTGEGWAEFDEMVYHRVEDHGKPLSQQLKEAMRKSSEVE